jgi:hypothetical protein
VQPFCVLTFELLIIDTDTTGFIVSSALNTRTEYQDIAFARLNSRLVSVSLTVTTNSNIPVQRIPGQPPIPVQGF